MKADMMRTFSCTIDYIFVVCSRTMKDGLQSEGKTCVLSPVLDCGFSQNSVDRVLILVGFRLDVGRGMALFWYNCVV